MTKLKTQYLAKDITVGNTTFVVNSDGSVDFTSTATAEVGLDILYLNNSTNQNSSSPLSDVGFEVGKSYIVSGCNDGGDDSYRIALLFMGEGGTLLTKLVKNQSESFTVPSGATTFQMRIDVFKSYSGTKIVKPMVTLADQPNSDYAHYVPYAKTNRELTEDIKKESATISLDTNYTSDNSMIIYKNGGACAMRTPILKSTVSIGQHLTLGTIPAGWRPAVDASARVYDVNNNTVVVYTVKTNGDFVAYIYGSISSSPNTAVTFVWLPT